MLGRMTSSAIRCTGLAYRYAAGSELRFPDVDIAQGATLLLRGASGAGKSTWLALVAGLLRPSQGQLMVAGQDLLALQNVAKDAWRARAIGFLPQKLHLSEALTVEGNLAIAQWAAGVPDDPRTVREALQALGIEELARRRPRELSGGQAQRVALARAVLMQPRLVLADEPTASLDDASAAAALELLQSHARRCGATLVIATHDARVVQALGAAVQCHIGLQPPVGGGQ